MLKRLIFIAVSGLFLIACATMPNGQAPPQAQEVIVKVQATDPTNVNTIRNLAWFQVIMSCGAIVAAALLVMLIDQISSHQDSRFGQPAGVAVEPGVEPESIRRRDRPDRSALPDHDPRGRPRSRVARPGHRPPRTLALTSRGPARGSPGVRRPP